jgi:hypothetical protein
VQLLDFVNDGLFWFILESMNRGFVVEKKIKIRELSVWIISISKNQQLEMLLFFNFKKIENLGSTPKADFRSFFTPVCIYPGYNQ